MRQKLLIGFVFVGAFQAQASPRLLSDDELKAAVVGKTVKIDTPLGMPLVVMYSANGLINGEAGTALGVYLGASKDRGRWSVRNGKLCQKWFKWLDAETTCMSIRQDGQKIFWTSDTGKTGTASIEPGPPVLAGASASGLGLPQPPSPAVSPSAQTADIAAGPNPTPRPAEAQAAAVRPATIVRPLAVKPVAAVPRPEIRRAAMLPMIGSQPSTPSIERESEASAAYAIPAPSVEPIPIRFAFASTAPAAALASVHTRDTAGLAEAGIPARGDAEPWARDMRQASQDATRATLEHRWCFGNAFSTLPSSRVAISEPDAEAKIAGAGPTLLAVSLEQLYERELPLYDAACLTEQPAIRLTAEVSPNSD